MRRWLAKNSKVPLSVWTKHNLNHNLNHIHTGDCEGFEMNADWQPQAPVTLCHLFWRLWSRDDTLLSLHGTHVSHLYRTWSSSYRLCYPVPDMHRMVPQVHVLVFPSHILLNYTTLPLWQAVRQFAKGPLDRTITPPPLDHWYSTHPRPPVLPQSTWNTRGHDQWWWQYNMQCKVKARIGCGSRVVGGMSQAIQRWRELSKQAS